MRLIPVLPVLAVLLTLILSGCGQKGPLYRPPPAQPAGSPATDAAVSPAPSSASENPDKQDP